MSRLGKRFLLAGSLLACWLALESVQVSRATETIEAYLPLVARSGAGFSLRFYGNGQADIDRVKIRLDDPAVSADEPGPPADVGAADFTLEFWMKANQGENENAQENCLEGNDGWIYGNIVFDRDIYGSGNFGDYGISLFPDGLAFGVADSSSGAGLCGTTDLADGAWHHVAVQRRLNDGWMWLYVDGTLQADANGPNGNVSYDGARSTGFPNSDPFLVIGAEKHDAGSAYPSFAGWIDEVRLSSVLRYASNFTRPAAPFTADMNTAALYHFDEGNADTINDTSGAAGGPSNGTRQFGGTPAGPVWTTDTPF